MKLLLSRKDWQWQAQPGEQWGILGSNGSGKTTFLHTLSGLLTKPTDTIWLDENQLTTLPQKVIAQSIALLFQNFNASFPQTVWDYCQSARYPHLGMFSQHTLKDKNIINHALETMELSNLKYRLINQLSGGEKRRVALASVLAQTPRIYLLDEPLNHLDLRHQIRTLEHFKLLTQRDAATVVMSLHDINFAQQYCSHLLLFFPDGSTIQGKAKEILSSANLSKLYQYPIQSIQTERGIYWHPESARLSIV